MEAEPSPTDPFAELTGEERTIRFHDSAAIGGAPVAYVIVLAAVITVLSFIPFSIVLAGGSSFPMAQGVYSLNGWLLGPWGGFVASAIGALVEVFWPRTQPGFPGCGSPERAWPHSLPLPCTRPAGAGSGWALRC